ncbi:hypothetical protein EDE08_102247 [Bradyrhizobium sp. R2.2-H]|jgi:hypothetical protein|uniref:hypothetical protein n=1 Tax=unclassified Bradyrhizobium TaxID=2631580 RepID=UPI00104B0055|nr:MULTISPECIES: hypothetical protein [unclassified Bradyrhizobium]TCU76709.1 hypothetical protein EDE10_102247 [Bradyrhizobium sp. Y-H1]TCU79782.1 hypothetical protein EDE08_102247 [Bradyrhizobium sp. R2.2-H]
MRATHPIEQVCPESALKKANAKVFDLGFRQDESGRLRRIKDLKHENALLIRMVSETQIEIARLRDLLEST